MKTCYIGHDQHYQQRKAEGLPGWGTSEQFTADIAILSDLLQTESLPGAGTVLELGCGAGNISLWLAEKGYEVDGVDIAPSAIAWAYEKAQARQISVNFQLGNVLDLKNYADAVFDIVLDGHCFHCIIGNDRQLFLASARRVLKPTGVLVIRTMCGELVNETWQRKFDPQTRCLFQGDVAVRYIGLADDILHEIEEAGFTIVHHQVIPRNPDDPNDLDELIVVATKT
jgi:2-polyprenyl-3-methyl-5-hydroxy-6-metoxy-1,4-benzoquinol methylase